MGTNHDNANPATGVPTGAQWPHLDKLWSSANIDLVCFDNYLPYPIGRPEPAASTF
ncbi:MAG: hypothetical protein DLM68_14450 [Hyphomicrobiales bacterium]|nr:MAG: hypothetical protein DLM68_14450 [Hyphomicrobiales bacterium]